MIIGADPTNGHAASPPRLRALRYTMSPYWLPAPASAAPVILRPTQCAPPPRPHRGNPPIGIFPERLDYREPSRVELDDRGEHRGGGFADRPNRMSEEEPNELLQIVPFCQLVLRCSNFLNICSQCEVSLEQLADPALGRGGAVECS